MPRRLGIALLAGVAVLAFAGAAAASPKSDSIRIRKGLTGAQKAHWLKPADTARYRSAVGLALLDTSALPKGRVAVIASVLNEVARQSGSYTSPRALALFSMLETNLGYLETHVLPRSRIDINGDDGVVYRWFGAQGFQFHPLANFGALNNLIAANDADGTRRLATALVARAVPRGPGLRWEYYFPFGDGRPPWTSGMAQAVAAQALSRAGALAAKSTFTAAAVKAYAAVPVSLLQQLARGPWIKLYSFHRGDGVCAARGLARETAPRGPVVQPLHFRPPRRAERTAAGDPLARGLRGGDERSERAHARHVDDCRRAGAPAEVRHRLLVAVRARWSRGAARVPEARHAAVAQARGEDAGSGVAVGGGALLLVRAPGTAGRSRADRRAGAALSAAGGRL